jgi:myo-inositol-1-phosphate synthase
MDPDNIHVGPSDYVPFLLDRKYCHIRMEGRTFGDVPLLVETKLEVWDSPNSAGVVIDALRCIKLAMDNGLSGELTAPASYFMKTPMIQYSDEEAHKKTEEFIKTYALVEKPAKAEKAEKVIKAVKAEKSRTAKKK